MEGTVPINFRGQQYNIPVNIWLHRNYPLSPPTNFVIPTTTMIVKPSKHVDSNGRLYMPYLHHWASQPDQSNLVHMTALMIDIFGQMPPLFSRPATGGPPQPQPQAQSYTPPAPQPSITPQPNLTPQYPYANRAPSPSPYSLGGGGGGGGGGGAPLNRPLQSQTPQPQPQPQSQQYPQQTPVRFSFSSFFFLSFFLFSLILIRVLHFTCRGSRTPPKQERVRSGSIFGFLLGTRLQKLSQSRFLTPPAR